jgi:putative addiction module component (TIGR02574 family)
VANLLAALRYAAQDQHMAKSARERCEEAMRLGPEERATLMRRLSQILDAESEEGVDDAWRVEIERRMAERDLGSVQPIPWEELRARLYRR